MLNLVKILYKDNLMNVFYEGLKQIYELLLILEKRQNLISKVKQGYQRIVKNIIQYRKSQKYQLLFRQDRNMKTQSTHKQIKKKVVKADSLSTTARKNRDENCSSALTNYSTNVSAKKCEWHPQPKTSQHVSAQKNVKQTTKKGRKQSSKGKSNGKIDKKLTHLVQYENLIFTCAHEESALCNRKDKPNNENSKSQTVPIVFHVQQVNPFLHLEDQKSTKSMIIQCENQTVNNSGNNQKERFSFGKQNFIEEDKKVFHSQTKRETYDELCFDNKNLRKQLLKSYQKMNEYIRTQSNHLYFINAEEKKEVVALEAKIQQYREKCKILELQYEQKETMIAALKKQQEKQILQNEQVHRRQAKRIQAKCEIRMSQFQQKMSSRLKLYQGMAESLKIKQQENDKMAVKIQEQNEEISSLRLKIRRFKVDVQKYEQKIEKLEKDRDEIRRKSQALLHYIQNQIQKQGANYLDVSTLSKAVELTRGGS